MVHDNLACPLSNPAAIYTLEGGDFVKQQSLHPRSYIAAESRSLLRIRVFGACLAFLLDLQLFAGDAWGVAGIAVHSWTPLCHYLLCYVVTMQDITQICQALTTFL